MLAVHHTVPTSLQLAIGQGFAALASNPHIQSIAMGMIGMMGMPTVSGAISPCEKEPAGPPMPTITRTPNCFIPDCPDLKEDLIHPREKQLIDVLNEKKRSFFSSTPKFEKTQEYLRFRRDDPKDKVLIVAGDESWNDAINPKWNTEPYSAIADEYDVKYKVIDSFEVLCHEINAAAKVGHLAAVIVDTHGNNEFLLLSNKKNSFVNKENDFKKCFEKLPLNAKIIILPGAGEGTKENPLDSLAQKIASQTNREIIASSKAPLSGRLKIEAINPLTLSTSSEESSQNVLRTFYPGCENEAKLTARNPNCLCPPCADLIEDKLHTAEKKATTAIESTKPFLSRSNFKITQEYQRLHRGDPRPKALYLIASEDHNGGLNPLHKPTLLSELNNHFDLKVAVIDSYQDVCHEISQAAKVGKLTNVIINGHGNPEGVCISECAKYPGKWIKADSTSLSACFSGIQPYGRVLLQSCSAGAAEKGDSSKNFAQDLANLIRRTVVAARELSYPNKIEFNSVDPLNFLHYPEMNVAKNSTNKHKFEDNLNLSIYRTFQPNFTDCHTEEWKNFRDRELLAIESINDYRKKMSLKPFAPEWKESQSHIRLCKKDPREKFIIFTGAYDREDRAKTKLDGEFLSKLSDRYDLEYRVAKSQEEICQRISEASKMGKLVGVALEAPLSPEGNSFMLWKRDFFKHKTDVNKNQFTQYQYEVPEENTFSTEHNVIAHCMKDIDRKGIILLLSDSAGAPSNGGNPFKNVAQQVATNIERIVIAPTGTRSKEKRIIVSFDPLTVFEPEPMNDKKNIYKKFHPQ